MKIGIRPFLSNRYDGFTLIEVLVALTILTIAVLGIGVAVGVQTGGTAKGVSYGLGAVSRAGLVSTATFLAQDRLEQVKRLNYTTSSDPFGALAYPTGFADEALGTIPVGAGPGCPCYPNFSRQVRFQSDTPAANIKLITVTVSFSAPGDDGSHTESVAVSMLMAARQP